MTFTPFEKRAEEIAGKLGGSEWKYAGLIYALLAIAIAITRLKDE